VLCDSHGYTPCELFWRIEAATGARTSVPTGRLLSSSNDRATDSMASASGTMGVNVNVRRSSVMVQTPSAAFLRAESRHTNRNHKKETAQLSGLERDWEDDQTDGVL
jgi:hypothetical protein